MYVVGKTTTREIFVASDKRAFILDEYLIINDEVLDNPVGEVIETFYFPRKIGGVNMEAGIVESLEHLGIGEGGIYLAKVRVLNEYAIPVRSEVPVTIPNFDIVEELLMPTNPNRGLVLGVINGTGDLKDSLPVEYQNIAPLYSSSKGIYPQSGVPFVLDHYSFREYPHVGFFGGSGSGKTFAMRVFTEEVMKKGLPALVFDPHFEFSFEKDMPGLPSENKCNLQNKYETFTIGRNLGINFTELRTEELLSLIEFVADLTQPMVGAIQELHQEKDTFTTLFNRTKELRKAFEFYDRALGGKKQQEEELPADTVQLYNRYKEKIAGTATLQAVCWRLDQLNKTGIFNHDINGVEACLIKRKLAVIRGKQKLLKMIASYLLNKLYKKRRLYKDYEQNGGERVEAKFPPFVVIIDESHDFAPNSSISNPTKRILKELSQEARKYGVIEVFGTQRPGLLDTTITAQLSTKFIFKTNIASDMDMIARETSLNEQQIKRLPTLTSGNAFVSSATLRKTMYVKFKASATLSPNSLHPYDELDGFNTSDKLSKILEGYLPIKMGEFNKIHSEINNKMKRSVPLNEIIEVMDQLVLEGKAISKQSPFGAMYLKEE